MQDIQTLITQDAKQLLKCAWRIMVSIAIKIDSI